MAFTPILTTSAATAEARIVDANGKLIAHATTTCLVFAFPKG